MNKRAQSIFLGVFLIIVPPALMLVSATLSVDQERLVREGIASPSPIWSVVFPLALIACFLCIPLGAYVIFKALKSEV